MNVIVLMADSWRFDYLGCYGNDWIRTPNIDRLAKESVVFENAYAEGCPTIPTRRTLFTGRYTLPYSGWRPLTTKDRTLTDLIWTGSVRTALVTDTSMMHLPGYGYERGFDYVNYIRGHQWDPFYRPIPYNLDMDRYHKPVYSSQDTGQKEEILPSLFARSELMDYLPFRQSWKSDEDHMVAQVCRAAMNYLETVDRKNPFFLWLDSFDPHEPWDPPSVWDPDLKCPYDPDYDGLELINPVPTYVDGYLTEKEAHHIRMLYAEKITMVDKWLGEVLDKLQDLDLYENTLIIFLSDHGEPFGNGEHGHGIMRKCRPWPYEELSHIPLIIKHPEGIKGRVSSFVETVDIAPTILDFLGAGPLAGTMQGKSLIPLMQGKIDKVKEFAITGYYNYSWSMVTPDWSFIHWIDDRDSGQQQQYAAIVGLGQYAEEDDSIWTCTPGSEAELPESDELYDRRQDPFQLKNLLNQKAGIGVDLSRELIEYMTRLKMEMESL